MKLFGKSDQPFYTKRSTKLKKSTLDLKSIATCASSYNVDANDHARVLLSAAYSGDINDLNILFVAGLDPEVLRGEGKNGFESALLVAIHGGNIETARFLVFECGLNPLYLGTSKQPLSGNAFHAACLVGNFDVVQLLYSGFKAGLSARDYRTNSTPIADAIGNGHFDCARQLIENNYVNIKENCMNKLDILGVAFSCYVNGFIGKASSAKKEELIAFCLYLIDEKDMNPYIEINGNKAAIDVFVEEKLGIAKLTDIKPGSLIDIANENKSNKSFTSGEKNFDYLYLMLINLNIIYPEGQPLAQRLLDIAKEEYAESSSAKAKRYIDAYAYFESQNPQLKVAPQPTTSSRSTSSSLGSSGDQS